jgi:hypothetical protein
VRGRLDLRHGLLEVHRRLRGVPGQADQAQADRAHTVGYGVEAPHPGGLVHLADEVLRRGARLAELALIVGDVGGEPDTHGA